MKNETKKLVAQKNALLPNFLSLKCISSCKVNTVARTFDDQVAIKLKAYQISIQVRLLNDNLETRIFRFESTCSLKCSSYFIVVQWLDHSNGLRFQALFSCRNSFNACCWKIKLNMIMKSENIINQGLWLKPDYMKFAYWKWLQFYHLNMFSWSWGVENMVMVIYPLFLGLVESCLRIQ